MKDQEITILRSAIMRSRTNGGHPCKQYIQYAKDDDGNEAVLIDKYVLLDFDEPRARGFEVVKIFKDKKLTKSIIGLKLETISAINELIS